MKFQTHIDHGLSKEIELFKNYIRSKILASSASKYYLFGVELTSIGSSLSSA